MEKQRCVARIDGRLHRGQGAEQEVVQARRDFVSGQQAVDEQDLASVVVDFR